MDQLFKATEFFPVSDGTVLAHLINSKDIEREMGLGETGSLSIAHGKIASGVTSEIHVLPCVDQVTYVLEGELRITMQDKPGAAPYERDIFELEGEDVRFEDAIIAGSVFDAGFERRFIEITSQVTEFAAQREQAIARMSA